jgi:hypothetical protein
MTIKASDAALYAACAEAMFAPGLLTPELDSRMSADWSLTSHILGSNALLGLQGEIGEQEYFGFGAVHKQTGERILVIRGTEQPIEWLENLEAYPLPFDQYSGGVYAAARVEGGFYSIMNSLVFQTVTAPSMDANTTLIGHSLGAAIAAMFACRMVKIWNLCPFVYLFASPKPGDSRFAVYFDWCVGAHNYQSFAYVRDLVPHLPITLPLLNFSRLNNTTWLKADDSIPNDLQSNHSALTYRQLLQKEGL